MKEIKVAPIKNGTVIDHIPSGMALKVLKILGVGEGGVGSTVSVAMHVPSKKTEWKDIVKVEDRELDAREVDKIALIAPTATINIIRNFSVAEKHLVKLPEIARGILICGNPNCISNQKEPVESEFLVSTGRGTRLTCVYCEREVTDVLSQIL